MLRRALEGFHMAIPDGRLNDVQETSEYDIAITGAAVAGLTAALLAARLGDSTLVIERFAPGSHLVNIESIEDFPGFPNGVAGYELGPFMQEQAANQGAQFQMGEVGGERFILAGEHRRRRLSCQSRNRRKRLRAKRSLRAW